MLPKVPLKITSNSVDCQMLFRELTAYAAVYAYFCVYGYPKEMEVNEKIVSKMEIQKNRLMRRH